jgi:DNA-binding NarL/FixJ family response regulator
MNNKTRVFLVDDHPAMRHGIAQLVAKENDLEVCGEAGDRRETLNAIAGDPPDLIILDIALKDPDRTGLDLVSEIHACVGPVPILIYSMHDEKMYAERALRAGARGYLMKQEPVRRIIHAIRAIIKDGIYVSEQIGRRILLKHIGASPEQQPSVTPEDCLSEREFEVFRLIGKGLQPREIAEKLCLSTKTVETHRMNIRKKFGMANASEVIQYAVEWSHMTHRETE